MQNKSNDSIRITGLWKRESKDGKVYFPGNLSSTAKVLMFKNDNKKNERDPDLILYLAHPLKWEQPEEPKEPEDDFEGF